MKRIIIIGGGAAGVGALWALRNQADIKLFEAEQQLGGHAYSYEDIKPEQSIYVDMGVEYFNERLSPNLFCLFEQLQLETFVAPLSFCAYAATADASNYWSNSRLGGKLNQRYQPQMNRFHQQMLQIIQHKKPDYYRMSIGEYLNQHDYSDDFQREVLLPLMTTFSGCQAPSLDYSLMYIALSFSMNLLSFFSPCHWRKLKYGVSSFYKKVQVQLAGNIHLGTPVRSVAYNNNGVQITLTNGQQHCADEVIFACRAELALKLITNPTKSQQSLLSQFEYVDVTSTVHTDESVVPNQANSNEYFQFSLLEHPQRNMPGYLTRVNNNLSPYHSNTQAVFTSFDCQHKIAADKVLSSKVWKLPKLRPQDLYLKKQIHKIQGINHFWYCGSDFSLTGHEGAFVSGLVVANRLGDKYPFAENIYATTQFNLIKDFMGVYSFKQSWLERIYRTLYKFAKRLNLPKRLSHYYAQDYLL